MDRLRMMIVALLLSTSISSCTKNSCERYCDCRGIWDPEEDFSLTTWSGEEGSSKSCEDQCEDDVRDGAPPCRKAFRAYSHCIEDNGCDETRCVNDAAEVMANCLLSGAI